MLAEKYETRRPTSRASMILDSVDIIVSFCDEDDLACHDYARGITEEQFWLTKRFITYPGNFTKELLEPLRRLEHLVTVLTIEDDINCVVSEMTKIKTYVEDIIIANDHYKVPVLCGISIAMESSKLWHSVYNDPSHALYGIHYWQSTGTSSNEEEGKRRLDQTTYDGTVSISLTSIVLADLLAGLDAAMRLVSDDFSVVTTDPRSIFAAAAGASIPASMGVVAGGTDTSFDEDDNLIATFYFDDIDDDDDYECAFGTPFTCR